MTTSRERNYFYQSHITSDRLGFEMRQYNFNVLNPYAILEVDLYVVQLT